jgi:Kef-type K+ transport system membrane component KefB
MGQLIAGILLGPSVLGALWPDLQQAIFPKSPEQKSMIDAVSQLGVLMLLLLTGMETDLAVVKKAGRAALSVTIAGISVPFLCGVVLGELLPDAMLPNPDQRLITSHFLGTALSISSVKIVAMVIREMNFMRRDIGQIIMAAAITRRHDRMDYHRHHLRPGSPRWARSGLARAKHFRSGTVPARELQHRALEASSFR